MGKEIGGVWEERGSEQPRRHSGRLEKKVLLVGVEHPGA